MVRRTPVRRKKPAVRGTTKTPALLRYHQRIDMTLEDLEWIASDQLEEDDEYRDPRTVGYAPVPELLQKVPYNTKLTLDEMHAFLDDLAAWAQASGLVNVLFTPEEYASFIGFKPFTPAERQAAKQAETKKALAASKRKETARQRKVDADRKEEEKQRNLLRVLAKKYPEEIRAVNEFEN